MKTLNILTILFLLTSTIVLGQTRCDTIGDQIFSVTEDMPTSNISIEQLENILNNSINLSEYPQPDRNVIYLNFIINCNGEDFDYKVLRPIDKGLKNKLLPIIESNMTWTPAKQLNIQVDFSKTFEIRLDGNRFNILDEKEQKTIHKKK